MSALTPTLEPARRRAAQIARIEALRGEVPVSRYAQRLIEPAAWGWLMLTFLAASLAMAGAAAVAEHVPGALALVLNGVALFLSVVLVDALFVPVPNRPPAAVARSLPAAPRPDAWATAARTLSWTIRIVLLVVVLAASALTTLVVLAPDASVLERMAMFLAAQRDGIEHRWRADTERPPVRGRTSGVNWRLLERDGRYVAVPLAEATRLCAGLGAGWQTPQLEDFGQLEPPPDEPSTLHVWVTGAVGGPAHRASVAQIVAGSWRPTGFLSSDDTARDHFHVLCVRPEG